MSTDIIRIKGRTLNGLDGVSVIRFASTVTSIAGTADRNTSGSFATLSLRKAAQR